MTDIYRGLAVFVIAMTLAACGAVHNSVLTPPSGDVVGLKKLSLAPINVTSTENNADAAGLNEKWRKMAADKLNSGLQGKGISTSGESQGTVDCNIAVTYGNRALRYWVGFGAGKGTIRVVISLRDAGGSQRYSVQAEADLAVGVFGGSMSDVASKTIDSAVSDFLSKL